MKKNKINGESNKTPIIDTKQQNISLNKIKELLEYINGTDLDEVYLKTEELTIKVKRTPGPSNFTDLHDNKQLNNQLNENKLIGDLNKNTSKPEKNIENSNNFKTINSPMIGTFYRSPTPDSPPFVNVGDTINKGQAICIIEAMKLFNEIESDISGKVIEILVEDASPVEFDQPLFLIEPN